jgi:hypothetical protein
MKVLEYIKDNLEGILIIFGIATFCSVFGGIISASFIYHLFVKNIIIANRATTGVHGGSAHGSIIDSLSSIIHFITSIIVLFGYVFVMFAILMLIVLILLFVARGIESIIEQITNLSEAIANFRKELDTTSGRSGWLAAFAASTALILYMGTNDWLDIPEKHLSVPTDQIGDWARPASLLNALSTFVFAILISGRSKLWFSSFSIINIVICAALLVVTVMNISVISANISAIWQGHISALFSMRVMFVSFLLASTGVILVTSALITVRELKK